MAKAVYSLDAAFMGICQYPLRRSKVVSTAAGPRSRSVSWITESVDCELVQASVVYAEAKRPFFLGSYDDGKCVPRVGRFDHLAGEHHVVNFVVKGILLGVGVAVGR